MTKYESKIICKWCKHKLHIVDMEEDETIEECPYCGGKQKVIGKKQTKIYENHEYIGGKHD